MLSRHQRHVIPTVTIYQSLHQSLNWQESDKREKSAWENEKGDILLYCIREPEWILCHIKEDLDLLIYSFTEVQSG